MGASWNPLAVGVALGLLVAVAGGRPAVAADLENGETVFQANCASCHAGGNNSIVPEKKIKKAELEQYLAGGYKVEAIITQVTNGKNSMPAFGESSALTTLRMSRAMCMARPTSGEPGLGLLF